MLTISIEKPLLMIEVVPEVRAIHNKVRTSKNAQNKRTLAEFYSQSPMMLPLLDTFRILDWKKIRGEIEPFRVMLEQKLSMVSA